MFPVPVFEQGSAVLPALDLSQVGLESSVGPEALSVVSVSENQPLVEQPRVAL